jgi:nucleoside-diphosphate-sugar epimerase
VTSLDKENPIKVESSIIRSDELVLVTGSNGFIGCKVVETLLESGYSNLRCFVRPTAKQERLTGILSRHPGARVEITQGNLLSREDCSQAARDVRVMYHLAAGFDKSYASAFMNSVLTTRNLLDAAMKQNVMKRFVNVSSFAVYSGSGLKRGAVLDESCEIENPAYGRYEAYAYAKIKQEELVLEYSRKTGLAYVILRPGAVYGPGKPGITGRVGIDTFGVYLHMGGSKRIPFTYVDNCASAIVLAGLKPGIDGEVFNVVDDDLPRSRKFLRLYKKNVRRFLSIPVPYPMAYLLCAMWEKYSNWSEGQLPPVFNRSRCSAEWKGHRYSNEKLKRLLGWTPKVRFEEASQQFFKYLRETSH